MSLFDKYKKVTTPVYYTNIEEIISLSARDVNIAWHVKFLDLPEIPDGEGVRLAVLDTGAYPLHPSLNSFRKVPIGTFGNYTYGEHGTAVMSILIGNGYKGINGLCPSADVFSYPVLSPAGVGSMDRLQKGLKQAFNDGADIVNISLGSPKPNKRVNKLIDKLLRRGTIVVAAGGNSGKGGGVMWPAKHDGVISVGSINSFSELSSFSSTQDAGDIDIVAPGDKILVATNHKGSGLMSGTSFAAPVVSGTIATLLSTGHEITKEKVEQTALDLFTPGIDPESGFGLFNPRGL